MPRSLQLTSLLALLLLGCTSTSEDSDDDDTGDSATDSDTGDTDTGGDTDTDTGGDTDTDTGGDTDTDTGGDTDTDTGGDTGGAQCVAAPANMIFWLRGEGNSTDEEGTLGGGYMAGDYAEGRVGQAFALNGVDEYLAFDPVSELYLAGSFTVEAWIATDAASAFVLHLYECGGYCPTDRADSTYGVYVSDGRAVGYYRTQSSGEVVSVTSTLDVDDGAFHHVVMARDVESLALRLWVDGVLEASQAIDTSQAGPFEDLDEEEDPLTVGASRTPGGDGPDSWFFDGRIDELTLYSAALGTDDVTALFEAGAAGKCTD